jgi:hypothetical protein
LRPQPPQLLLSVFGFTHAPPHMICIVGQPVSVHAPATQACPAAHFIPQAPQFWKSVCVSKHVVPQSVLPTSQPHLPARHAWLLGQAIPQPPQFAASLFVSMHRPLQSVRPVAQPAAHIPALQTCVPHDLPQLPQLVLSDVRSTQLVPQRSSPTSHTQLPALQICDAPQAIAQSLQCAGSLFKSTQLAPHLVRPVEHIAEQMPRLHTSPIWHAMPHAPQLAASVSLSVHPLGQRICPAEHDTPPPSDVIMSAAASLV